MAYSKNRRRAFKGSKAIRINKIIYKEQYRRGKASEERVYETLCRLRDQYNFPIIVTRSERGSRKDGAGIDIEVKGRKPFNAWFGIDVKSSESGVSSYLEEQRQLGQVKAYPPRYPFLFNHQSGLELEIIKFILEKSNSHQHLAIKVPEFKNIMGPDYHHDLRWLIYHWFVD